MGRGEGRGEGRGAVLCADGSGTGAPRATTRKVAFCVGRSDGCERYSKMLSVSQERNWFIPKSSCGVLMSKPYELPRDTQDQVGGWHDGVPSVPQLEQHDMAGL